jgi:hypothetical protein
MCLTKESVTHLFNDVLGVSLDAQSRWAYQDLLSAAFYKVFFRTYSLVKNANQ